MIFGDLLYEKTVSLLTCRGKSIIMRKRPFFHKEESSYAEKEKQGLDEAVLPRGVLSGYDGPDRPDRRFDGKRGGLLG